MSLHNLPLQLCHVLSNVALNELVLTPSFFVFFVTIRSISDLMFLSVNHVQILSSITIIIILMSCHRDGYPWPSLATSPYHSLLLAVLQGYIPYPHIAPVCMFELVVLFLLGHMRGVHRGTSLMNSSLLLQQCPACLVRLTSIVFVMEGRWPYTWCLVGCCCQDLFNMALSILV